LSRARPVRRPGSRARCCSTDRGEVTDKGSINQRAVLENRSALIEEIYSPAPPAQVITL
jgi:feruloyl-CoA synthase